MQGAGLLRLLGCNCVMSACSSGEVFSRCWEGCKRHTSMIAGLDLGESWLATDSSLLVCSLCVLFFVDEGMDL